MKKLALFTAVFSLLALFLLAACSTPDPTDIYTVRGTVRNVWVHDTGIPQTDVTFEHDYVTHEVSIIRVYGYTPLWAGEHCAVTVRRTGERADEFLSSYRLP